MSEQITVNEKKITKSDLMGCSYVPTSSKGRGTLNVCNLLDSVSQ